MATHSSILAWRIPWTEEPGGLQSIGLPIGLQRDLTEATQHTCTQYKIKMYSKKFPCSKSGKNVLRMLKYKTFIFISPSAYVLLKSFK